MLSSSKQSLLLHFLQERTYHVTIPGTFVEVRFSTQLSMYMYVYLPVHVALSHYGGYMYSISTVRVDKNLRLCFPLGSWIGTWCAWPYTCTCTCRRLAFVYVCTCDVCVHVHLCVCTCTCSLLITNASHIICNVSLSPSLPLSFSPHFHVGWDARQCPSLQGGLCAEEEHHGGTSQERYS